MRRTTASLSTKTIALTVMLVTSGCAEQLPTEAGQRPMLQQQQVAGKGGRLLVCPTRETLSASGVIGREGGTVEFGGHWIRVGAGAITEPVRITLTAPAGRHLLLELTAGEAKHFAFQAPVEVSISYARCNRRLAGLGAPAAWHVDDDTGELLDRMGGDNDPAGLRVTFRTSHLSTYAVAY